jgi:hypothetical protein
MAATIKGILKSSPIPFRNRPLVSPLIGRGLACLALLLWVSTTAMSQTQSGGERSAAVSAIHVTHVLGFEGARRNTNGELRIRSDSVLFKRAGRPDAQVPISSIQNIFLGEEDKQVGGVPMMLGKAAVPYGGGSVVSLFSHKKYDSLTIEYIDNNGGFHSAIFRLKKGQGQAFKKDLVGNGAHIAPPGDQAITPRSAQVNK